MFGSIAFLILPCLAIIWSSCFLPVGLLGIRLFRIQGNKLRSFMSKIKCASIWTSDEPDGWICGYPFIGYIHSTVNNHGGITKELYLLTTTKFYKKEINKEIENKEEKTITFYEREGVFWRLEYTSRQLKQMVEPTEIQTSIIQRIIEEYNQEKYSIPLLYGKPGCGKSMISILLCNELLKTKKSCMLVDTFNPTDPGDTFSGLYNKLNPSEDKPLIVVIEEIDIIIQKLYNNDIKTHEHIPIQIKNKTDWNTFLDRFDRKMYPHVILMLTTNKTMDYFDELDSSYLRDGRTTMKIHVKQHNE